MVENVVEFPPEIHVVSFLALLVEAVDSGDEFAFMIPSQKKHFPWVQYLKFLEATLSFVPLGYNLNSYRITDLVCKE